MPTTPPIVLQRPLIPGNVRDTSLQQPLKVAQDALNALQARADAATTGTVTSVTAQAPLTGGTITESGNIGLDQTFLFGPIFRKFVSTTTYTFLDSDVTVFSDTSAADTAVTVPDPTANAGRVICVARTGAVNKITLNTVGGHNIDGAASQELGTALGYAGSTVFRVILQSDGTQWLSVAWAGKTA